MDLKTIEKFVDGAQSDLELMNQALKNLEQLRDKTEAKLEIAKKEIDYLKANSRPGPEVDGDLLATLFNASFPCKPSKSTKISDPAIFSGLPEDFFIWREAMLLKLNVNADHFPSEQAKMVYVYSRLHSNCQALTHSWIKDGVFQISSCSVMMDTLTKLFDDPSRVRNAKSRIFSNKQRNRDFSSWITEIRRDAALAGYTSHEYNQLKDIVLHNMSLELKKAMIHERDIDLLDFDEAIFRLQDIESRQRAYNDEVARDNSRRISPPQSLPQAVRISQLQRI